MTAPDEKPQTPYDVLGGETPLRAVVNDFVDRVFDDMMIGFMFRNADKARVKEMEFQLAAEFLGGPVKYAGRPLRQAHAPHRIMGGQFGRRTQILRDAMAAHDVPQVVRDAWLAHTEALRDQVTVQPDGACID